MKDMLPDPPLDEGVELEAVAPAKMDDCKDMHEKTDGEDNCPCIPAPSEPPLDDM